MFWVFIATIMVIIGSIYTIPQAIRAYKRHNIKGFSIYFLILWFLDKTLSLCYTIHIGDIPLIIKYSIGFICISYFVYLKFSIKD